MTSDEIIIFDDIEISQYEKIIESSLKYAIISIPFTYNRMDKDALEQRIINIAKGKISEGLFKLFCVKNQIQISFEECKTPFFKPDKRDFVLNSYEWDIKNNYLYHKDKLLDLSQYLRLPALIPSKNIYSQWSKRNEKKIGNSKGIKFLFTFMKNLDKYKKGRNFINLILDNSQKEFIKAIYEKHASLNYKYANYSEDWYWNEFFKASDNKQIMYSVLHYPKLVITGFADESNWDKFVDLKPTKISNGLMNTIIPNKACRIEKLPSFKKLIFPY